MSGLRALLSDRHRPKVALVLLIFLVGSGWYWVWLMSTSQLGDRHAIIHPTSHPGEEVVLSLWEVEAVDSPTLYRVAKSHLRAEVEGATAGLVVGEDVSVGVEIRADGSFAEQWREPHPDRPAKDLAAFLALGFLAVFLPLAFTVRGWRVVPRG